MKKLLLVVDYQKDFVDGSLGFEDADKLEEVIVNKISDYRKNNFDVAFVYDTHTEEYLDTLEGKYLPVEHCIKGTEGWEMYGKVNDEIKESDKVFHKITFGSIELFDYLRDNPFDEIELVGLVSNICIITNALLAKTAQPETEVIVDRKATDTFDKELDSTIFDVLKGLQIKII